MRRALWSFFGLTAAMLGGTGTLLAQESASAFPSKNVEFVIPFAAGGTADVLARIVAQGVADKWGKPIIVQNKAGATGAIASEYVSRAQPDGYTLLMATGSTHTVNPAFRKDLPFNPIKDFTPLSRFVVVANVMVVNPTKVPVKTVPEFIAYLKANPGKLNFGSSGLGSSSHFAGELFALMTNTTMTHVPYRGTAPALADLIAGNVDVLIDNMSSLWPLAQQGTLRAIAVASPERSPIAPDLPTVAETLPGYEAVSWNGVVGPAGMPPAIAAKIAEAFTSVVKSPQVTKRIEDLGASASALELAEFQTFIEADLARWARVAKERNLTAK